jgi:hypothetical protein
VRNSVLRLCRKVSNEQFALTSFETLVLRGESQVPQRNVANK